MSTAAFWLTLCAAGVVTFLLRWSFIGLAGVLDLPRPIRRTLAYVPAAVLAAIIAPAVLVADGHIAATPDNLRLPAVLVAAAVAWRTQSIFFTIAAGMGTLWLLTAAQAFF